MIVGSPRPSRPPKQSPRMAISRLFGPQKFQNDGFDENGFFKMSFNNACRTSTALEQTPCMVVSSVFRQEKF